MARRKKAQRKSAATEAPGRRIATEHPTQESLSRPSSDGDAAAGAVEFDWRGSIAGRTSQEVLDLFVTEDPLDLRARVARRLRARAWLVAADRVLLRAIARLARAAPDYRGAPPFHDWIELVIEDAVLDLLREDCEAEAEAREPGEVEREAYVALAEPLGLAPEPMRRVCIAFNRLDESVRRAFLVWVVEGRTLAEAAVELGQSEELVAERARSALEAVLSEEEGDAGPSSEGVES